MERNSDLIVMASLCAAVREREPGRDAVGVDLIGYDALAAMARPRTMRRCCSRSISADSVPASALNNASDRFFYSATTDEAKGKLYLKLVNGSSEPRAVAIHLTGATKIGHEGVMETLTGTNPAATNTTTDPERIVLGRDNVKDCWTDIAAYCAAVLD